MKTAATAPATPKPWLRHPTEVRQIGIVVIYLSLLGAMYFVPACRNLPCFLAALYFSFLNSVVIHNHLHQGVFNNKRANMIWRGILSFGSLYPASANVPSHNLVHHHFDDDGRPDWAAPEHVEFKWHLLNVLHFPNVVGTNTFSGVTRWLQIGERKEFKRQYIIEQVVAFGLTGLLLINDFWGGLFFVVLPQLYGARMILRINLVQHDACDIDSDWNHSRNFVGRAFNWIMCNNGYHTIHHNRAGLHWSQLAEAHEREVVPRIHPSLNEPSMVWYVLRTFGLNPKRPNKISFDEQAVQPIALAPRAERIQQAEQSGMADVVA